MKVSSRERAALRTMVEFARCVGTGPTPLGQVAETQDLSLAYLERIVPALRKAGLISSVRGAHGGYRLTRPAAEISVGDVFRAVEDVLVPVDCVRGDGASCRRQATCATRTVWTELARRIGETLDTTTLADVIVSPQ
jgi:Rrf2 family protein